VLEVSEIENLLLQEQILEHVAAKLEHTEVEVAEIVARAKAKVFDQLKQNRERVAVSAAMRMIELYLSRFGVKVHNQQQLENSWQEFVESVGVKELYVQAIEEINEILDSEDYEAALRVYDNKGLVHQVSGLFDMRSAALVSYIKRLVSNESDPEIVTMMRHLVPRIAAQ